MKKQYSRTIAVLTALVMVLVLVPVSVMASEAQQYQAAQGNDKVAILMDNKDDYLTSGLVEEEFGDMYYNECKTPVDFSKESKYDFWIVGESVSGITVEDLIGGIYFMSKYDFENIDTIIENTPDDQLEDVIDAMFHYAYPEEEDGYASIKEVQKTADGIKYEITVPAGLLDVNDDNLLIFDECIGMTEESDDCVYATIINTYHPAQPQNSDELWVRQAKDGNWYQMQNGKVVAGPNIAQNEWGWWYCDQNGKVDFGYTGVAENQYGWWRVENGCVNFDFTGLAQNQYGWWRIENGKVNFDAQSVYQNEWGWWKCTNGKVDFDYTGIAQNEYGWWRIENGCVNFSFNGICTNEWGTWYLHDGFVDFGYTATITYKGVRYNVINGYATKA